MSSCSNSWDRNREYTGSLFRVGAEEHSPDVLVRGLERNIKRRFSWSLVARNLQVHAFPWSKGRSGGGMTIEEIRRYLDEHKITEDSVAIVDTRIVTRADDIDADTDASRPDAGRPDEDPASEIQQEWQSSFHQLQDLTPAQVRTLAQNRFLVVPREVGETLDGFANSMDTAGFRALEVIIKQKPARIMLGALNVPWLQYQIASNAMITGLGGGKNPLDIYGAHKWFKGLEPDEKLAVEAELGITHGRHFAMDQPNLGATTNRLVNFYRAYKKSRVGRGLHKANPLDWMFRADEAQNNFFRKVLFYNQAKRDAYRRLGGNWRGIDRLQGKAMHVLGLPADEFAGAIATHGPTFEKHAKHVKDFLGDYVSYTPSERFLLSHNVIFYGFLRHSLKFTFYTMPVQHPIMSAILGDIGRLGAQEIKRLFGVPPNAWLSPSMLGKAYLGTRENAEAGELRSLNFGRMNPMMNALTSMDRASQITSLVSPIYQDIAEQLFGESTFTGKDYRVRGMSDDATRDAGGPNLEDRARIQLRSLLQLAYPYRLAEKTGTPAIDLPLIGRLPGTGMKPLEGPQGDDSLLWSPRPNEYSRQDIVDSIERDINKQREAGAADALKRQLFPLVLLQVDRGPRP